MLPHPMRKLTIYIPCIHEQDETHKSTIKKAPLLIQADINRPHFTHQIVKVILRREKYVTLVNFKRIN